VPGCRLSAGLRGRVCDGRSDFLFAGHADGGHNLAVLQSLCSTCLLHGANPYEYLKGLAVRVRTYVPVEQGADPDLGLIS
jgi:hypothetical protein